MYNDLDATVHYVHMEFIWQPPEMQMKPKEIYIALSKVSS